MRLDTAPVAARAAALAALLVIAGMESASARQAKATLSVTVRVAAACGATLDASGHATAMAGCPTGSAPVAVLRAAPAVSGGGDPDVAVETTGDLRYVTILY